MPVLNSAQRKLLERVVVSARDVVDPACRERIRALGVAEDRRPPTLSDEENQLRLALRARARQLGSVEALVAEAGFEHWHRMLFAKILVDNGLLVDDVAGMPVSWAGVREASTHYGVADPWQLAASWAAHMLPGVFRADDPVLQIRLPVEARQALEQLLGELPTEVTTADDALGWVYQYWQSQRKDEVNRSERKIGGADLAPVTQLFTEDYMVRFLLENSLGAWWAARHPESRLLEGWEFLRFGEDGSPAAGGFEEWPEGVAEVTVMDPCCGSGHFLVAAFGMLWRMRAEEDGLDAVAAQNAVLRDNLFGLELDERCTQIAVFALAVQAWKDGGGYRVLPVPNVACSGIPAKAPLAEWTALAGGDARLEAALARLHALFAEADTLGSLIDPRRAAEDASLESVDWHVVAPLVQQALTAEASRQGDDPAATVFGQAAADIVRAADLLSRSYTLVVTNVPYLGRGKFGDPLRRYAENSNDAGGDLATLMLDRCFWLGRQGAGLATVTPQSWLAQAGFRRLRRRWFAEHGWPLTARLGGGAFAGITGEVVQVLLVVGSNRRPCEIRTLDVAQFKGPSGKASALQTGLLFGQELSNVLASSDVRPVFGEAHASVQVGDLADAGVGIQTGDNERFTRCVWELPRVDRGWIKMSRAPDGAADYSGSNRVLLWESGNGRLHSYIRERLDGVSVSAWIRGENFWDEPGILLSRMGDLPASLYAGGAFADNCMVIAPKVAADLPALWLFASSGELSAAVRAVDQSLSVTPGSVMSSFIDDDHWRTLASERFPAGLQAPNSDDPTQWIFKGEVAGAREPLQVAVARLVGFSWPGQEKDAVDGHADSDGVVCLPAVGGEEPAADRLVRLLADAYRDDWSLAVLDGLLAGAGAKRGAAGLEKWLRDGFFKQHCKVFANRPFIWQVWDGRPDGFSALVNYHKLDRRLLERLTYNYLGSWWIGRQRDDAGQELTGAEARLAAATALKQKLELILEGQPPYDIYVRWKSLAQQPMGWEPDLDDGVRLNIRPFMNAGVLRAKPTIHWKKDRGKNLDGSERQNDPHFTLAEKQTARLANQKPQP